MYQHYVHMYTRRRFGCTHGGAKNLCHTRTQSTQALIRHRTHMSHTTHTTYTTTLGNLAADECPKPSPTEDKKQDNLATGHLSSPVWCDPCTGGRPRSHHTSDNRHIRQHFVSRTRHDEAHTPGLLAKAQNIKFR